MPRAAADCQSFVSQETTDKRLTTVAVRNLMAVAETLHGRSAA